MTATWTRVEDLVATLRSRWNRGRYLRSYAAGEPWTPVALSVRAPTADDLLNRLEESLRWVESFRKESSGRGGRPRFVVEQRMVRSRALGDNAVPLRIRIDSFEQLCELLGTSDEVALLDDVIDHTRRTFPDLVAWVTRNPRVAAAAHDLWEDLLRTVRWIVEHDVSQLDIRHLDIPGVDTKFVEQHRKLLGQLLSDVLAPEKVDPTQRKFANRYGFRSRPSYTRFRLLAPVPTFPACLTELELRTEEFGKLELPIRTVFIVENKATFLAFPAVPDAIVVFGEGFGVTSLEALPWLADKELVYWGDIDTHGFAILHRLRDRLATVTSILMDRSTLLAHSDRVVTEDSPTSTPLPCLTAEEHALYRDLVEDRYGKSVRLEQERIRFSLVSTALSPWLPSRAN